MRHTKRRRQPFPDLLFEKLEDSIFFTKNTRKYLLLGHAGHITMFWFSTIRERWCYYTFTKEHNLEIKVIDLYAATGLPIISITGFDSSTSNRESTVLKLVYCARIYSSRFQQPFINFFSKRFLTGGLWRSEVYRISKNQQKANTFTQENGYSKFIVYLLRFVKIRIDKSTPEASVLKWARLVAK